MVELLVGEAPSSELVTCDRKLAGGGTGRG